MATVPLSTGDEQLFEVPRDIAMQSEMIKALLSDIPNVDKPIPIKNVQGKIFSLVINYCTQRVAQPPLSEAELKERDEEFVKVDQATLFELILAANYLNIKELLDLLCLTVANMIKGKTPVEIRKTFNIKNDFTAEEEEEVRRENAWSFE